MTYAYPYNPLANDPSCIVKNEVQALSDYTNKWRCVVPVYAPFFRESLVIKHVDSGRTLYEGIDFYLTHYCKAAATLTKRSVFGSIMLTTPLTGQIKFEQYMILGGQFTVRRDDVLLHLADVDLIDPRNEDWEAIMRYIRPVEPVSAPNNINEAISFDLVAAALNKLNAKYVELNQARLQRITSFMKYLWDTNKFLKVPPGGTHSVQYYGARSMLSDYDLLGHQYRHDAHHITYQQLAAYGKNQDVDAASMVYALRLDEIIEHIYFCGVNDVTLDRLYDLAGGPFAGALAFTDAPTSLIGSSEVNAGGKSYSDISFAGGNMTITSFHDITFNVAPNDTEEDNAERGFPISAGNNVLMLSNIDGTEGLYPATFNGNRFITADELTAAIGKSGSTAKQVVNLKTAPTDTISISGNGGTVPLLFTLTRWQATTTKAGMFIMSQGVTDSSTTRIASAYDFATYKEAADQFALMTYTINGKPLTADITLTADDFGLGNVDNTAIIAKPIADAFIAAVNGKAPVVHTHDFKNMQFDHATPMVRGLVKLTNTYSATDTVNAATPQVLKPFNDSYNLIAQIGATKFDKMWVNIAKFVRGTATYAGFNLHLNADTTYNVRGYTGNNVAVDFNLATLFPETYRNNTFYLTLGLSIVEPDNTAVVSITDVKTDDSDTATHIGTVVTNSAGIVSVTMLDVMRFINVAELIEHISEDDAHGWDNRLHALGLDNIQNKGLSDSAILPTFSSVFNTWYRFSHAGSGVYPAMPSEVAAWSYNATTDQISNSTNSTSVIGMVSNETAGDYVFDVLMSSTAGDDDYIGLVLCFYKDPVTGKEHTLSAIRVMNGGGGNNQPNFFIAYNYGQADQAILVRMGAIIAKNWSTVGTARIKAVKTGNVFVINTYTPSGVDPTQPLEATYTLDMTTDARLSVFLGESRYGYVALSQPYATWTALRRPDADGTTAYASMAAVKQVATAADDMLLVTGTVVDGASVPIPTGYTLANVKCTVVPYQQSSDGSGIKSYVCDVDSTLKVSVNVTSQAGVTTPGVAKYYLYGVK